MVLLEVTIIQLDHERKLNIDVLQFYIPCNQSAMWCALCSRYIILSQDKIHNRLEDKYM